MQIKFDEKFESLLSHVWEADTDLWFKVSPKLNTVREILAACDWLVPFKPRLVFFFELLEVVVVSDRWCRVDFLATEVFTYFWLNFQLQSFLIWVEQSTELWEHSEISRVRVLSQRQKLIKSLSLQQVRLQNISES